ncbi:MAG: T9SS type A sorting domain-containing protein, partial [Bacteroidales bacterium]|nr:T9SS type A sorting domain-containing protein [Bacteroidales bacterium]
MKHSLTLVAVFCLLLAQSAFAQNIELTFTGADAAGKYVRLDSVKVESISRSWTETIVYPDTILTLTDETGVSEVEENISSCISYPNPFNGTSRIVLTFPQDEQLSLRVYNLAGQLIMEKHLPVEAGESHFEVTLNHPQVYFLVAQTTHGRLVQKLINTGHSGTNGIVYRGTNS